MNTDAWISLEMVELRETDDGREILTFSVAGSDGSLSIGEVDVTEWETEGDLA